MKYLTILFLAALISCSNHINPVEKAVQDYAKSHANDPSSYQPVENKIDSFFADFNHAKLANHLRDSLAYYDDSIFTDILLDGSAKTRRDQIWDSLKSLEKSAKPIFWGWKVTHTYRAKNAFGALVLDTDTFYVNKNFEVVPRDSIVIQ